MKEKITEIDKNKFDWEKEEFYLKKKIVLKFKFHDGGGGGGGVQVSNKSLKIENLFLTFSSFCYIAKKRKTKRRRDILD